jgi:glycosyltransferase involved in cell wall biosynthesis
VPDATLTIVGRTPSPAVLALAKPGSGITVTGTVPDVRPYLARAAVVTVPLRIGGGTRIKIYEALGMDCPLVSTRIGAEGLPLTDATHIRFADSAADLADATIAMLRDPSGARAMGQRAGAYVRQNFSWERAAERFADACASVLPARTAAPSTSSSIVA